MALVIYLAPKIYIAQQLKRLPAMQETQFRSLGWEDSLEKGLDIYLLQYFCLENSMERSLVGYSPRGRKESETTERLHFHFHFHFSW